jgi:CHASE3 domain sensor protein
MEKKLTGKILILFSLTGLILSLFGGIHYYTKTEKMEKEMNSAFDILYSLQGAVSHADMTFSAISDTLLLSMEKVEGILDSLDSFLSTLNVLSPFLPVDITPFRESGNAVRGARNTISVAQKDINSYKEELSEFKGFLDTLSTLKQRVEETAGEAKRIIIATTIYLCLLNVVILWCGWTFMKE